MLSICRIDERLIHGQVASTWVSAAKATCIVIADDEAAGSLLVKQMNMMTAQSRGVKAEILPVADAAKYLLEHQSESSRELLIIKTPAVILRLIELGVPITEVIVGNIGNTGSPAGKKRVVPTVNITKTDVADFKALSAKGVKLDLQVTPDKKKTDFMTLI